MLMSCQKIAICVAVLSLVVAVCQADDAANLRPFNPCLAGGIKKSVVFLGLIQPVINANKEETGTPSFFGTGALINFENYIYLATAAHVVHMIEKAASDAHTAIEETRKTAGPQNPLPSPPVPAVFFNKKNREGAFLRFAQIKSDINAEWVESRKADVALIAFPFSPDYDIMTIPDSFFLNSDALAELQEVFFMSYQPSIPSEGRIVPIARQGMISVVNDDASFYLDAFAFPGNSGSPVFVKPLPTDFSPTGTILAGNQTRCRFVGIVGEYITYQEVAFSQQTKRARVIFEENTGLARVWPVQILNDLFKESAFLSQHKKRKEASGKPSK